MDRFIRKTEQGYDVYIGGDAPIYICGRIENAEEDGYAAYGSDSIYGYDVQHDSAFLGFAANLPAAARLVAENEAALDAEREAQHESERAAEFGMSYVCGGGSPSDVAAAYAQFKHSL